MKESRIDGFPDPHNYEKWWDFTDQPQVSVLQLNDIAAHADADGDTGATCIGIMPSASIVIGGYAAVGANSTGVTADPDDSAWVVDVGGTGTLTKTFVAEIIKATPAALTVATGSPAAAAGAAVTLAITNGTNADLNAAACHISLAVADANNYPAPGLKAVISDLGTATIADGAKGILAISPGSSDNDEIYICASTETQKFASGTSFVGEIKCQFTEANTDDANVIFGFMNAVAADTLVDNAGGPRATGDYVAIWKIDGGTKFYTGVQSNNTAVPAADVLTGVTAGGSSYQKLKIKVNCYSSTQGVAEFWIDEQNVATTHFDYASATEMQLFFGVKNGGGNAQALNVDLLGFGDNRTA